jgi:hypothetical protein
LTFLQTNDGLVAARAIIRIGKLETWPHGYFYPVSYQLGDAVIQTRATEAEVQSFLEESDR